MERLTVETPAREALVDIGACVADALRAKAWRDGILLLFCPHTSAALTVNEATDPDVARDIAHGLRLIVPRDADFHHAEGNSDAHIKSSLVGPDLALIVEEGRVRLGRWQGLYFVEGDGPRKREVWMKFIPAS